MREGSKGVFPTYFSIIKIGIMIIMIMIPHSHYINMLFIGSFLAPLLDALSDREEFL